MASDTFGGGNVPRALTQMRSLQMEIDKWRAAKGHKDVPRSMGDECALLHSEISEALEHHRDGRGLAETFWSHEDKCDTGFAPCNCNPKPDGIPIEMADLVIRALGFAEEYGFDLGEAIHRKMRYNAQRAYRHGRVNL